MDDLDTRRDGRNETLDDEVVAPLVRESTTIGPNPNVLLVDDRRAREEVAPCAADRLRELRVPNEPVTLALDDDEAPHLVALDDRVPKGKWPVFVSMPGSLGRSILMLTAPGSAVRVHGLPAPIVAPLALGDEIVLEASSLTLYVSRLQSATATAPPPQIVGTKCEVCLTEFTRRTRVVFCPHCGHPLHLEGEETPSDARLECARLGACPHCGHELPTEDGHAFVPEDR